MSTAKGFAAVAVAVAFFGSSFVPVKKFETGDGIFFQWVLCSAIWVVGVIINLIRGNFHPGLITSIPFYPYAMLGGAMWCIGNAMAVTIIKCIGLGIGMCVWGGVNLIMGWASGTFGLFGLHKQTVPHPTLNYVGAAVAICSVVVFVFVKTETGKSPTPESKESLLAEEALSNPSINSTKEQESFVDKMGPTQKRILGITLAIISGIFYGVNFDPPQYIMDHTTSKNGLDYVFSHFSGIYIMSTLIFAIYAGFKKNQPIVYPRAILPGLISGVLWAVAQSCWFIANANLEMVVAFPLIATAPGLVANLWGIFAFKEIRGVRNFVTLIVAFVVIIVAVVLISLSKLG